MKKNVRSCAQCRSLNDRHLLFRIQINPEGQIVVNHNLQARSLYLCQSPECLNRAGKNKHILRKLKPLKPQDWHEFCLNRLSKLTG